MAQESDSSGVGLADPERDYLADFPFVIEGELSVPLDYVLDQVEANTIFAGFEYLLFRELRKREPGLLSLTFAIPPAVESFEHLIKKEVAPAVQVELQRDNPHAPPRVIIITVRPPSASERSEEDQGDHLPDGFST